MRSFFFFAFLWVIPLISKEISDLKILHLSFHRGCVNEVNQVAEVLDLQVDTWFIHAMKPREFDGTSSGSALYNIGYDRAERIWQKHRKEFEKYDVIITSDTVPLSRIFLQQGWSKPLIVWMCNRIDYTDTQTLDCDFPDAHYYQLLREAIDKPNVHFVAYTRFEHHYAYVKGVNTGEFVIKPCSPGKFVVPKSSSIPKNVLKKESFFLPPYHNELFFMDLASFCKGLGISAYCGRYNGHADLADFKGVIHLPYAWSNLALFENARLGLSYLIPSKKFARKLMRQNDYFFCDMHYIRDQNLFELSEWYDPDNQDLFTYFDSWKDLQYQVSHWNALDKEKSVLKFSENHQRVMLERWKELLEVCVD